MSYGNTAIIEDDINQCSISISISREQKDQKNGQELYKVVCGKWTKTVVKYALKETVKAGIKASGITGTTSLIISGSAELAALIYDAACDYYEDKYGDDN